MMVRAAALFALVSAGASCRPAGPIDPVGYGSSTSVRHGRAPTSRSVRPPSEVLAGKHRAPIELVATVPAPGGAGSVIAYAYGRLEARIGEHTASGHDVVAELAEARRGCDEERAALDPDEREWVESENPSCESIAAMALFGDDQLVPECEALAVAYFDPDGILLSTVDVGGPCLSRLWSFEAYDLTPEPDDELMLTASFDTFGELTRGGWGRVQQELLVHVLAIGPGRELHEQLEVELDVDFDGGNCNHGIDRSLRVPEVGSIEVFSQRWNECAREHCVDPAEAAAAAEEAGDAGELPDDVAICELEPITAGRHRWIPEERSWTVLEGFEHHGTQLPDGIRR